MIIQQSGDLQEVVYAIVRVLYSDTANLKEIDHFSDQPRRINKRTVLFCVDDPHRPHTHKRNKISSRLRIDNYVNPAILRSVKPHLIDHGNDEKVCSKATKDFRWWLCPKTCARKSYTQLRGSIPTKGRSLGSATDLCEHCQTGAGRASR
jgi:hypothetical protein